MKGVLLTAIAAITLLALLPVLVLRDPGYVLISWQQTSVELSLGLALLLWGLSLLVTGLVCRLLTCSLTRS